MLSYHCLLLINYVTYLKVFLGILLFKTFAFILVTILTIWSYFPMNLNSKIKGRVNLNLKEMR